LRRRELLEHKRELGFDDEASSESWKKLAGAFVATDFLSKERRRGLELGER